VSKSPLDRLVATVGVALKKAAPELLAEAAKFIPGQPIVILLGRKLTQTAIESLWPAEDDPLAEIRRSLRLLLEAPLRTGLEQLRLAAVTVPNTPDQAQHQADRLREARASLDTASQQVSSEQRSVVDLYRGLASLGIPGGLGEGIVHLEAFMADCRSRAIALSQAAAAHDRRAVDLTRRAKEAGAKAGPWIWGAGVEGNVDQAYWALRMEEAEDELFASWELQQASQATNELAGQVDVILRALK
jgi:hypothetical protein